VDDGRRHVRRQAFNSPNDLCYDRKGNLYFTDPPYGWRARTTTRRRSCTSTASTLLRANGRLVLLTRGMTFPNGVALSPDEKTLYVASPTRSSRSSARST
jgi:gluconolactonase